MKKIVLCTTGIFLMAVTHSAAQTHQQYLQTNETETVAPAIPAGIYTTHAAPKNYTRPGFVPAENKNHKWNNTIAVSANRYGFDNTLSRQASSQQYLHLPSHLYFFSCYSLVKPVIYTATSASIKLPAYSIPKVNVVALKPADTPDRDLSMDAGSMNINLTKNTTLSLDLGYTDETDDKDTTGLDSFADSYGSHDLDITVGVLFCIK